MRTSVFGLVIVLVFTLGAFTTEARAEHVDWSNYIDHNAKPTQRAAEAPAKVAPTKRVARATKISKNKNKRAKVKARANKKRRK